MAFVFGALIEFALVNYVAGEDSRKKQQQTDPGAPTKVQADDPPITQSMPELVVNDYGGLQVSRFPLPPREAIQWPFLDHIAEPLAAQRSCRSLRDSIHLLYSDFESGHSSKTVLSHAIVAI